MEHLFFNPCQDDLDRKAEAISGAKQLECDWSRAFDLERDITWPVYQWLHYDHNEEFKSDVWHNFTEFGALRGWKFPLLVDEPQDIDISKVWKGALGNAATRRTVNSAFSDPSISDFQVAERLLGFIQSWLVFGFLEATCERVIDLSYLTRPAKSALRVFDTRNLTYLLYAQNLKMRSMDIDSKKAFTLRFSEEITVCRNVYEGLAACLEEKVFSDLDFLKPNTQNSVALYHQTLHDILSLATMIWETTFECFKTLLEPHVHYSAEYPPPMIKRTLVPAGRLVEAGFCKAFLRQHAFPKLCIWYWLQWWAETSKVTRLENHTACEGTSCALEKTPDTGPQHTQTCRRTTCQMVAPPSIKVLEAIDEGDVPLVQIRLDTASSTIDLAVRAVTGIEACSYIAFSHVWRHGLGSCTETGLPRCQLQRLWDILALSPNSRVTRSGRYMKSSLFWIDSLCIPSASKQRRLAIQSINLIYQESEEVIIIDKGVLSMSKHDAMECVVAAIVHAAWRTRLWTWLEGYLPQNLSFATSDCLFKVRARDYGGENLTNFRYLVPADMRFLAMDLGFTTNLWSSSSSFSPDQRWPWNLDRDIDVKSKGLFDAIENRTTTKASDEPLILAAALGLDLRPLTECNGEERMRAFYTVLSKFPSGWLFLGISTLSLPNFHWAPITLQLKYALISFTGTAPQRYFAVASDGLRGSLPVISLEKSRNEVHQGESYGLRAVQDESTVLHGDILLYQYVHGSKRHKVTQFKKEHDLLILQQEPYDAPDETTIPTLLAKRVNSATESSNCDGEISCKICGLVGLRIGAEMSFLRDTSERRAVYKGTYRPEQKLRLV